MKRLKQRVRRVTEDLREIESTLRHVTSSGDYSSAEKTRMLDELLDLNLAHDFKSAVDHMRHFLWGYIEAAGGEEAGMATRLRVYRVQRATEMLRVLHEDLAVSVPEAEPVTATLIDRIHTVATLVVDRTAAPAPAEQERGKS
jgi:hypothetical protein